MFRFSRSHWVLILIVLIFLPIFFQISNGLYVEQGSMFNSCGDFLLLPIPLSVLVFGVGILLLGDFKNVQFASLFIVISIFFMLLTSAVLDLDLFSHSNKLTLAVQYLVPMFALVLGQQIGRDRDVFSRLGIALFGVVSLVVVVQLFSTLLKGMSYLSPSLFLFSIYQHLQYVPVLMAGAFLIAMFSLWDSRSLRPWLLLLSALMGLYASLSISMLTVALLIAGVCSFALHRWLTGSGGACAVLAAALALLGVWFGLFCLADDYMLGEKFGAATGGAPVNVKARVVYWDYYLVGITESFGSLLLGHSAPPGRDSYPSAHNYYLDFIYNFGLVAFLPLLVLIGWTIFQVARRFLDLWRHPAMLALAGVLFFLLLADNNLKVGMRQPYPGIITFFLWGVLLAWLLEPRRETSADVELKGHP